MNEDLTRIEMEFPTPKLTNKKTKEKEIFGTEFHELSKEYNLPEYIIIQILEHKLPEYTYLILEMLYKNNLIESYLKEFD